MRNRFIAVIPRGCSSMPGICGAMGVSPDKIAEHDVYAAMTRALMHRSDYGHSHYADKSGRVRIGAVGHQDLIGASENLPGALFVSYGKPFNRPEGDVVVGGVTPSQFSPTGNFSSAQYDPLAHRLCVRVDRYASEPVFYTCIDGVFYFAPEVKALLAAHASKEIDYAALASFIGSGHFLGDQTLLSNVRKLQGGQELIVTPRGIEKRSYWTFEPGIDHNRESEDMLSAELARLLEDSMKRLFHRREDELIFLSGGLDSRAILAGGLKAVPDGVPIRTVSWGASSDIPGSDQQIAASIARQYGLEHRFISRRSQSYGENVLETLRLIDGQCDVPCMHPGEFRILASLEAMGVRKVFRGDEAFGWHSRVYSHLGAMSQVGIRRFSSLPLVRELLAPEAYKKCEDAGDEAFKVHIDDCKHREPNDAKDILYFTHRLQNYLGPAAYYKRIIYQQLDPLLCDEILDFMRLVPGSLRFDKAILYSALRHLNPQLAQIPYARHSGLESWAEEMSTPGPVRAFLETQVSDESSEIWTIFDRSALTAQLKGLIRSTRPSPRSQPVHRARQKSKKLLSAVLPRSTAELSARRAQAYLPPEVLIMRFIVLKYWFDELINRSPGATS